MLLPQGRSSLLSESAPQRTETEPTKDWYDSVRRGLPSFVANPLLQLVTALAEMKSRDLLTIVPSFCKFLTGRIIPSLIDGARRNLVVPCSKLYKTVASFSRSLQGRITLPLIYGARQKVAAASLLLIIVPTAVIGTTAGLALGLIKARNNVNSSSSVSLPAATIAPAPSMASPANSHDLNKSEVTTNVEAMPANPQSSTVHLNPPAPLKNKDSNSFPPNAAHGDGKVTLHTPLEVKVVEEKPAVNPHSQAIAVVVQIEEGRVKEAYVQNPQAGLGAFEATALRRARNRRYPKETTRKETVILQISNQPSP